ncbi:MAG: ABC transporter substrate-binding protein, partial [Defluviitaleaceae bacterium]|nr:ABC transporter substrate-binding protein [Defluviitaleaceae bacterium]
MNAASLAPVGSGPFKFKEQTGRNIILTRNPNFRYNVYLSYVNIVISPDRETDFNAFLGNVVTALTTNMSELAKYGISITPFNTSPIFTYELDFFAFNTSNPHFSDVRVREAITLAFPFNALYNVYIGQITRSSSFVHPNSRHYVEGFLRENDLNRAFEELIEVGFSVENDLLGNSLDIFIPFMLRILVNTENTERLSLANSLRNNLEQLGIQVNFMALPFNEFYEEVQAGNFDILFAGTQLSNNFSAGFMNVFSYTAPSLSIYELQRHINTQIPMVAIGFRNHILLTNREELRGNIRPSPTNPFQNVHEWFVGIRDI